MTQHATTALTTSFLLHLQKPVKRRALRKRDNFPNEEEDEDGNLSDESSTTSTSSSSCQEAVYDTNTARVMDPLEVTGVAWNKRLSCIDEKSAVTSDLESANEEEEEDEEDDLVIHYGDREDEEMQRDGEDACEKSDIPEMRIQPRGDEKERKKVAPISDEG